MDGETEGGLCSVGAGEVKAAKGALERLKETDQ
jgi:hypothetical protein